jgi:fibronectin type 3 domain-containing protein
MKRIPILFLAIGILSLSSVVEAQATTCVQGVPGAAPTAILTFTAPTANTDGSALSLPLTYNIYQSTTSGAETKVATGQKGSPISVVTGITPNATYYWKVSVTDAGGNESALSNEACKSFPKSLPGSVTITIT